MTNLVLDKFIEVIGVGASQNVLDVGGADGSLLLGILKKHGHLKGGVFDRPELEPIAIKKIIDNGFTEKVCFHVGDFFESVTEGYDFIVMKHILHDWNDEKASLILKNCRKVLKEGDKLFVIDRIIDKNSEFYAENLGTDFWMLVLLGAKERTVDEFENLFSKNGFKLSSVKKVSFEAVIEAVAV